MNPNYPQPEPPPPPPDTPHSGLAIVAFVLALGGFLIGLIPFAGFLGTLGLILAVVDLKSTDSPQRPRAHGLSIGAIIFGALSTIGALIWIVAVVGLGAAIKSASCPHLYSHDGQGWVLDADLASGALYKAAERDDLDRLESLRPVDGRYRLRIQNDLEEIDQVDSLALLVVDAPIGTEVLPAPTGGLVGVRGASPPLGAVDATGNDVLDRISKNDGFTIGTARVSSRGSTLHHADPRDAWTLEFDRPRGRRGRPVTQALLVVRAHTTEFAERAFMQYMASMGQGVRPLLETAGGSDAGCACYQKYLGEEVERLGLPIWVSVASKSDGSTSPIVYRGSLPPVSPAIARSQALVVDLPSERPGSGADRIAVRLEATPRFWEIDQLELAAYDAEDAAELDVHVITPAAATTASGRDALALLRSNDRERVVIQPGERVDVQFDAPPASVLPERARTVIARMRGFYEVDIGGQKGVDITRIIAHQAGWTSLPRFAAGLD